MHIPRALFDEMLAHAQAEAPNECCGFLATRGASAVAVHPARNAAASPLRFEIDSQELFATYFAIEDADCEPGVIYHSHTRSEPYPSQTDINFAAGWPGLEWVIVGLSDASASAQAQVRCYTIDGADVREVPLEVR